MKILFLIALLFYVSNLTGQEKITKHFDDAHSTIMSEYTVTNQGGSKIYHGPFKEYHKNGSVKVEGEYAVGQLHGDYKEFDTNKTLLLKCRYTNGILNGEYKIFYPSGNLKERKLYINGKIQGDYKFFPDAKDAEPSKIEKYQMGNKL